MKEMRNARSPHASSVRAIRAILIFLRPHLAARVSASDNSRERALPRREKQWVDMQKRP